MCEIFLSEVNLRDLCSILPNWTDKSGREQLGVNFWHLWGVCCFIYVAFDRWWIPYCSGRRQRRRQGKNYAAEISDNGSMKDWLFCSNTSCYFVTKYIWPAIYPGRACIKERIEYLGVWSKNRTKERNTLSMLGFCCIGHGLGAVVITN